MKQRRVTYARLRALAWVLVGIASYPLGWANSVALVWMASWYANAESAWTSAEAGKLRAQLDRIERQNKAILRELLAARQARGGSQE